MKAFVLAMILISLYGCKSTSSYSTGLVAVEDTRTYVSTKNGDGCVFASAEKLESAEAVAVALASTIIKEGVSLVGRALTEAGASKTSTTEPAFGNFNSSITEPPVCVQVVRGKFYPKPPPGSEINMPEWAVKSGFSTTQWKYLQKNGVYLSEAPGFLFEGQIAKARGASNVFTLAPIYLSYRESLDSDGLTFKSYRNISIALDFFSPATTTDKPIGSTILSLGRVDRGQIQCYGKNAQCQYVHEPNDIFVKSSKYFVLQLPEGADSPMYIQSIVTETREANEFVGFIGKVMMANDKLIVDNLSGEVEMMISRTKREEAKAQLVTLKETNRTAYYDAVKLALPVLEKCKAADVKDESDYFLKVLAAADAQRKVNNAAAMAEISSPFDSETFIESPSAAPDLQNKCSKSVDRIYQGA